MCTHQLNDGPLICDRTDEHTPGRGCTYSSTSGGPDAHTESSHE